LFINQFASPRFRLFAVFAIQNSLQLFLKVLIFCVGFELVHHVHCLKNDNEVGLGFSMGEDISQFTLDEIKVIVFEDSRGFEDE
jgi:hypothetical protein